MLSYFTGRSRAARSLVFLTIIAFAVSGCAASPNRTINTLNEGSENRRIVMMPADIELSLLNAGGVKEPRADWTAAARTHVRAGLAEHVKEFDAEMVFPDNADILDELDEEQVQIVKLANAVGQSIMMHEYFPPLALPTKADTFSWTIGPEAARLKEKYDADYALFMFMRDSYSSSGRVAVILVAALLGVGVQGGTQIGFASLVDLNNGNVVWFNRLVRADGDLRKPEAASETINVLMTDFPS